MEKIGKLKKNNFEKKNKNNKKKKKKGKSYIKKEGSTVDYNTVFYVWGNSDSPTPFRICCKKLTNIILKNKKIKYKNYL
jgi:aspartyl aminopeptidase